MPDDGWQKVREIFDSALRRRPDERREFVIEASGGDEALLAEVESLLASLNSADSFMETPAVAEVVDAFVTNDKKLEKGQSLGHYKIIKEIGSGGMGEVYLAKDQKLDRQVAVKILNEKFSSEESNLSRFIREAKAASALNHPNILVIHEIGEADGSHFIVSEYVEGETLRTICKEKALQLSEVLDISIQIAGALATAHKAHLIHRDIKPENIMLRPDGYVKILDFGLAKLIEEKNRSFLGLEESTAIQNPTAKGVIMGTVNYMSPEQARGKDVDVRTDIWSLGVVLYEMLTGKTPFASDTTNDTISAILSKNPEPLPTDMPRELERIVSKTLRKDRDDRYHHVKDLLIDLRDFKKELELNEMRERSEGTVSNRLAVFGGLTNRLEPSVSDTDVQTAATDGGPDKTRQVQTTSSAEFILGEINQHRRGVLAVLAFLLLSTVGLGYWFFGNRTALTNAPQIESIAVMPFINESGNADIEYLSDGMTETLVSSLSQLPNLSVKARSTVFRYKGKETNPQIIGKELNVQAILNGRVVQRGEQLTLNLELVDAQTENVIWSERYNRKTADLVSLQSEIARDVVNKLRVKLSGADEKKLAKNYTASPEAYQLYLKGLYHLNRRTKPDVQKAFEYFQQSVAVDPNFALGYAGLADIYQVQLPNYRIAPSSETRPKAKDAVLKALSLDPELGEAHTVLGLILFQDHDDKGAEREFQRAIELKPNYAMTYHYYHNLLRRQEKYEEALAMQRRALEIEPLSLIINREYGSTLYLMRGYDEAIAQFRKTVELDAGFPSVHYNFSLPYWMKGNYAEAVEEQARYQDLIGEPNKAALLRNSFAKGGWQGFLRMITDESQQFDLSWDSLTTYYAALGEKDKAFELLTKQSENRKIRPGLLADPRLDPLRNDPRFAELVKRAEPLKSGL